MVPQPTASSVIRPDAGARAVMLADSLIQAVLLGALGTALWPPLGLAVFLSVTGYLFWRCLTASVQTQPGVVVARNRWRSHVIRAVDEVELVEKMLGTKGPIGVALVLPARRWPFALLLEATASFDAARSTQHWAAVRRALRR